ncbi:hypothetical protein U9M48_030812 [Paspalum notatum var. saurae]|uniref:Uncharacterized protein n=1 Tax=Paspalum notatum var. saurae TaxID=547442 RepID=A0AAQ3U1R5_PASNO
MQVAVSAASWVVGKALAPVTDGLLEAWAASKDLGSNVRALKMELLYVKAMLENAQGREIRGPAIKEMLDKLRQLAYNAEDVLDELDYFRIQDELEGTIETTDADGRGAIRDAILNVRHTAKAVAKQLGHLCSCSRPPPTTTTADGDHGEPEQADDDKPRAICCSWPCAQQMSNTNDQPHEKPAGGCVHKLASGARHTARAAGKFFPFCCSSTPTILQGDGSGTMDPSTPAPKLEFRRVEISKRMKGIVDELKPLSTKVSTILSLGMLDSNNRNHPRTPPITTSYISQPEFFGRQEETAKIIRDITLGDYSSKDLTVLPIVGLGGMGKTTLAQHVYEQVEKYFEVNIWICVSVNFSVGRLTKEIAESIPKLQDDRESGNPAAEKLIEQRLKSKRFLLVLDDMWNCGNKDEWNKLLAPLRKNQTKGNIILVTTRSPALAQIVKSKTVDTIELNGLDDESYWDLFVACAFDDVESKNDHLLLGIGREIVKKLKGSPLAAKTVGSLLRNHLDAHHWKQVLDSKQWELQTGDHDIMPALKLSYDYLPFHLQQCFSYCTLFPKDYKFDRNKLIYWWIGLDILHHSSDQSKNLEDIGLRYLKDLEDYGFFKEERMYEKPCYIIHDLLHDLGLKLASHECLSIDRANVESVEIWPSIRHLSIIVDGVDDSDGIMATNLINGLRKRMKKLKTVNLQSLMIFGQADESLSCFLVEFIKNANSLRVLHLSTMIPHMELSALHIRYLSLENIDRNKIKDLPSMLPRFYLLSILNLHEVWHRNRNMPRDMSNLTKLRHFLTNHDEYHSQICNVGKLKFLQELKRFEVNKDSKGFEIKQLGNLAELRELCIYHLEKIQTKEEAAQAQLPDKIYLRELALHWRVDVPRHERDGEGVVLKRLQPSRNLQKLYIRGHGSLTCPTWLGSKLYVKALQSLVLTDVDWEALPWVGQMLMLNQLVLHNMPTVREFGPSQFGNITTQSFCNLKILELNDLKGLEKWDLDDVHLFSRLQGLTIVDCPELLGLPFEDHICRPLSHDQEGKTHTWFPNLQGLVIRACPKVVLLPPMPWSTTLREIWISNVGSPLLGRLEYTKYPSKATLEITGKDHWHTLDEVLVLRNLVDLQYLSLEDCPPLELKQLQMLTSLKNLRVDSRRVFVPSSECVTEAQHRVPVESLTIHSDHATVNEVSQLLSHLPNLFELKLFSCKKLRWLGVHVDREQTLNEQQQIAALEVEEKEEGLLLFPAHLSHSLQRLVIESCPELSLVASPLVKNDHHEARGVVIDGARGGSAAEGGLQPLRYLHFLAVIRCPKFLSAYESTYFSASYCYPFPSSLQDLRLTSAGRMGTLDHLSNLTSLTQLYIRDCGKEFRGEGLWTLLTKGQLAELHIYHHFPKFFVGSDLMRGFPVFQDQYEKCLGCPPKLQIIWTDDVAGVLAAPICTLLSSSLTQLTFRWNSEVERLTTEQEDGLKLLTSLQELQFHFCHKLQCLPAMLHTLPSLKRLKIYQCPAISSLPKDGLPISLQELEVAYCGNEELKQQCRNFVAVSAASWVVGKALAPVTDGLLEAWAASKDLGSNVRAITMELLYVKAMLEKAEGREIRGPTLKEMLDRLRQLAYSAEDVLDELDYFRIQDELEGTLETTTDVDGRGAIRDAILNVRHTAKAVAKQLGHLCSCSRPPPTTTTGDGDHGEPEQADDDKPRAICCAWPCAQQMSNTNDQPHEKPAGGCLHKIASGARHTACAAGKFFPFCCSSTPTILQGDGSATMDPITPAPKLEFRRVEISKGMKGIVDELKPLSTKVSTILSLSLLDSNRQSNPRTPPITTSYIFQPEFFGRREEMAKIIRDITQGDYRDKDLTVLPIVGLGGMGKTTLAQHVYEQVEKYFEVKIWICVSVNFSVGRLTKEIAESIPKLQDERESGNPPAEDLIEQRLKSKMFLLVLDDMWNCGNEDEWNKLLAPLRKNQTHGNIILVTTRSPALAQTVKSKTVDTLELNGLDDESYWDLFVAFAFDDEESKNDHLLLGIGREIVKKLKGSPLAAKTVGRLLRNHLDAHHWKRVLDSKEWELQTGDHDIMPALKLSYDYLPFHLQQCFSYCTLFPKDYKFDRNELIHWWIGLDVLHHSGGQNKSIEDIGLCYLKDLEDHGFFNGDKMSQKPCYTIHDLLHDLGLKAASHECLSIDRANVESVEIWPYIRHLSIIVDGVDDSDGVMATNFISELRK